MAANSSIAAAHGPQTFCFLYDGLFIVPQALVADGCRTSADGRTTLMAKMVAAQLGGIVGSRKQEA